MKNYFVINKKLDYERGVLDGLVYRNGRLRLAEGVTGTGVFFSRVFDSLESGTVWHRFTVDCANSSGVGLRISFYSFESEELIINEQKTTVSDLLRNRDISSREKKRLLEPWLKKRTFGKSDLLLHEIEGRYLVVCVELGRHETDNSLGSMCLYFPKDTWLKFLPGVYSKNKETADFTERFLGIFQSIYDDRDREIRGSAGLIHPAAVSRQLLEELAAWYDLKDLYLWNDDRLRELVAKAPDLSRKRGTASGLKEYLSIYLGSEPQIREDPEDPYAFTVLVPERYIDDPKEYRALVRVVGHMKPAGITARILPIKHTAQDSTHLRLGINSRLENKDADGGTR